MNNSLYAHCECASIDLRENTHQLQRFNEDAPVRQENEQLRAERDALRAFVERVSKQRPEKPVVAALFVQDGGSYYGLPGVDPWPESRDARLYAGRLPVVAHPPCQRWGKFWAGSPSYIARTGIRKKKGDDAGCFAAALVAVRKFGGVLEHPWGSHAWAHFGLNKPARSGGWIAADREGGWTCCVEQGQYGHWMRKPTLLYANGTNTPELHWGITEPKYPQWAIDRYGLARVKRMGEIAFKGGGTDSTPRIHTPTAFRDLLLGIALSVANIVHEPHP